MKLDDLAEHTTIGFPSFSAVPTLLCTAASRFRDLATVLFATCDAQWTVRLRWFTPPGPRATHSVSIRGSRTCAASTASSSRSSQSSAGSLVIPMHL